MLTARIRSDDNDGVGVVFRWTDNNNYWRWYQKHDGGGCHHLAKVVNGVRTIAASKTAGYTLKQWYDIRIEAYGSSIKVFRDGVLDLETTDSDCPSGRAGYYSEAPTEAVHVAFLRYRLFWLAHF